MSPYGQSVFADATDAIQAVDLTFDALINEIDVSKMRVFLSDDVAAEPRPVSSIGYVAVGAVSGILPTRISIHRPKRSRQ